MLIQYYNSNNKKRGICIQHIPLIGVKPYIIAFSVVACLLNQILLVLLLLANPSMGLCIPRYV